VINFYLFIYGLFNIAFISSDYVLGWLVNKAKKKKSKCPVVNLIEYHAMKTFGGVDV
jgi:hypothetical protein